VSATTPTGIVSAKIVLDWFEQAWDHSVFPRGKAFYPDAFKCQVLAELLNSMAVRIRAHRQPACPPRLPPMIEHGRKFLRSLPSERRAIEAELIGIEADSENAYQDVLRMQLKEILDDLVRAEEAVKATLAHWGVPSHKLNPAQFIYQRAQFAWNETIREEISRTGKLKAKIRIPLSANEGSPMTLFLARALESIGIVGYTETTIIAATRGKRHLARRGGDNSRVNF
jgi:hypothetical protein